MTRPIFRLLTVLPMVLAFGGAARADAVSDALQTALDAYTAGDLATASQNLTAARQQLDSQQSALLAR